MKTLAIRASVIALTLIGFSASSIASYSQRTAHIVRPATNVTPCPCAPSDPTMCGIR